MTKRKRVSELTQVARIIGNLPPNVLIDNGPGKWFFVGSVDSRLAFVHANGGPATDEQVAQARAHGKGFVRDLQTRVFRSYDDALDFASSLGLAVKFSKHSQGVCPSCHLDRADHYDEDARVYSCDYAIDYATGIAEDRAEGR